MVDLSCEGDSLQDCLVTENCALALKYVNFTDEVYRYLDLSYSVLMIFRPTENHSEVQGPEYEAEFLIFASTTNCRTVYKGFQNICSEILGLIFCFPDINYKSWKAPRIFSKI